MLYEGKKLYGPYTRKDGRQVVILKTPGASNDHQTVSYPKYLVEQALGRYLLENETVDHIDGDFSNNEFSNLRVVDRSVHCSSHNKKVLLKTAVCQICGAKFQTRRLHVKTCGSKSCNGRCAHIDGHNLGNSLISVQLDREYTDISNRLDYMLTVEEEIKQKEGT